MDVKQFLEILHVAELLKDTVRHCTTSKGRPESVAEHSWRVSLMALLLKDEFPEYDTDKVIQMCIIHDLGECFTGDIPVFKKTDKDSQREENLLGGWIKSLPVEVSVHLSELFKEMNEQKTNEAKLYKALDKLEALVQHNESPVSTWEPHEYQLQREYAWQNVEFSHWLKKLRQQILSDTEEKIARNM